MNNRRSTLIIFLLRYPQILERRKRRQNRSTDPHRVFALWRRDNLDLHACGRQARQLLLHAVRNTWVHRSTTREHNIAVQVTTDVKVALVDRVVPAGGSVPKPHIHQVFENVRRLVDTSSLEAEERRLEERLRSTESGHDPKGKHTTPYLSTTYRSLPIVMTCPSGSS